MAKGLMFAKCAGALFPAEARADEAMAKIGSGRSVLIDIRMPRSEGQHKLWWALCTLLSDQRPDIWPSKDFASTSLKIRCGHCDPIYWPGREPRFQARSIAEHAMAGDDFSILLDKAIDVICTEIVPNLEPSDLRSRLEQAVGYDPWRRAP